MNDDGPLTDVVIGEPKTALRNSWLRQGLDWLHSLAHHRANAVKARAVALAHRERDVAVNAELMVVKERAAADRLNADLVTEIERLKAQLDAASGLLIAHGTIVATNESPNLDEDAWVPMPPKRVIPLEVRTVETPDPGCGSLADLQHYCVLSRKSIWRGEAWRCHICGKRIPSGEPAERDVAALTRSRIAAGRVMQACAKVQFADGRKAPTNDDLRGLAQTEEPD